MNPIFRKRNSINSPVDLFIKISTVGATFRVNLFIVKNPDRMNAVKLSIDGAVFLAQGDWQKAGPHLEKMETLEADSVVGNYLIARHWFLRKDFARARNYAEKVKQSRPAHAELRNLLGQIYLGLGQRELSLREFEEAVRLAPGRADFRANVSKLKNQ